MAFTAAPCAFALTIFALRYTGPKKSSLIRLRKMSEWIYLLHIYIIDLLIRTARCNPLPLTKPNVLLMFYGLLLFVSYLLVRLSETKAGRLIGYMI